MFKKPLTLAHEGRGNLDPCELAGIPYFVG